MNRNNLEFDVVSVDQKNLESLVAFQVQRISSIVKRISVGQYIKSSPFEWNFHISIGKSKWILLLFLNGQYSFGQANDMITVYLQLIECEHQWAELHVDAKFQFGSESATVAKKNQRICFASGKTRWFGVQLIRISDMILNGNELIRDDVLMLTASLNERIKDEASSQSEMFWDNSNSFVSEPYLKAENKNIGSPRSDHSHLSESHFKAENKNSDSPSNDYSFLLESADNKDMGSPYNDNSFLSKSYIPSENKYHPTPNRLTKTVPAAERPRSSIFKEETYAKALQSHNLSTTNRLNSNYIQPTTNYNAWRNTPSSDKSDNASTSANGTGQRYSRNITSDSGMNHVDNEFSDDEDAKSTDSKKGLRHILSNTVSSFFGKWNQSK